MTISLVMKNLLCCLTHTQLSMTEKEKKIFKFIFFSRDSWGKETTTTSEQKREEGGKKLDISFPKIFQIYIIFCSHKKKHFSSDADENLCRMKMFYHDEMWGGGRARECREVIYSDLSLQVAKSDFLGSSGRHNTMKIKREKAKWQ